jgi:hypothetical protein
MSSGIIALQDRLARIVGETTIGPVCSVLSCSVTSLRTLAYTQTRRIISSVGLFTEKRPLTTRLLYKKCQKHWISVLFSIRPSRLTILEFQLILLENSSSTEHFRAE